MPRLQLRVYVEPGGVEIFLNIKQKDGDYQRVAATVDTGAAVTLLPARLLHTTDYRVVGRGEIIVEQAGIARQAFAATEAIVEVFLEDENGMRTRYFETRVWFAETEVALVGFAGILDRAILHIDMRDTRSGWIEIEP